jgi:hypothetical protein
VLLTADGHGTTEIMPQAGVAKTAVCRWQQRFMQAGVDGLLRDRRRRDAYAERANPLAWLTRMQFAWRPRS